MTGEDLGYKPDANAQAKFEYSPLGKVFNKGLDKEDKKEELLKRLKYIEDQQNIKVDKYAGGLYYGAKYNFNEYRIENYDKTSSIDSKFDTINKFSKTIKQLTNITHKAKDGVEIKERVERKKLDLGNVSQLYNEWIDRYKADYDKGSKDKKEGWKEKYGYKKIDDLATPQLAP